MLCSPSMRWLAMAAAMIWSGCAAAQPYAEPVVAVLDGDTIQVRDTAAGAALPVIDVRLYGVDAPEVGGAARCEAERLLGAAARAYVEAALRPGAVVEIAPTGRDKYGRRLAVVRADGEDLAARLIGAGLGRPYAGAARPDWCAAREDVIASPPPPVPATVPLGEGCCSHHGGVAGCSAEGQALCGDGTLSKRCTCPD